MPLRSNFTPLDKARTLLCMNNYSIPVVEEEEHRLDEEPTMKTKNDDSPVLEFSKSKITTDSTDD